MDEHRHAGELPGVDDLVDHLGGSVLELGIQHHAVGRALGQLGQRLLRGHLHELDAVLRKEPAQFLAPLGIRLDHEQLPLVPVHVAEQGGQDLIERIPGLDRLHGHTDRPPTKGAFPVLVRGDDIDGDVPRGRGVLEPLEHAPAVDVRKGDVEGDRVRGVLSREAQRGGAVSRDQRLVPMVVGDVEEHLREGPVVLENQEDAVPRGNLGAVVPGVLRRVLLHGLRDRHRAGSDRRTSPALRRVVGRRPARRRDELRRKVEGEQTPLAWRALKLDLSSQEPPQLAADGQPEPRAAVLAAGASVRLLERLEDDLLLLQGNPDPRVRDRERDDRVRLPQRGILELDRGTRRIDLERDPSLPGELEGVREQVLENLLQALGVRLDGARQVGRRLDGEFQILRLGHVIEGSLDESVEIREAQIAQIHGHRSRFDLREIEDVVDQVQEVVPGSVDGLGVFHLPWIQVPRRVLRKLIREDQEAVERRPELVRHVREELGLVLGRQGELRGFLFQRLTRLFHLAVLVLHLGVLMREEACLLL